MTNAGKLIANRNVENGGNATFVILGRSKSEAIAQTLGSMP